jgi:hypothetical protein
MATTDRQNSLLVSQDWQKIYRSFQQSDFLSYDFDTIRRTMIQYLQNNYPEDFNDYIESSEYIALIDLIAYLGQNLSFRTDLNARENFIDTAQRRDSILRLARLLSYVPKRNQTGSGLIKISSISTTESVQDSAGVDLSNAIIGWNDPTNANWLEQFIAVLNASLSGTQKFGSPAIKDIIGGVMTHQYKFSTINTDVPILKFTRTINSQPMPFELCSATFRNENFIYEEAPIPGNRLGLLYRADGKGNQSENTGFFMLFKQGDLGFSEFSVTDPSPNTIVSIDKSNVNNSDVWLYDLTENGTLDSAWTKVPAVTGNNVIYNSLAQSIRKLFSVNTRANDAIDLVFADGVFGENPNGQFRTYYRSSINQTYTIRPRDMRGVTASIDYVNSKGQVNTLTVVMDLQTTVDNGVATESNVDIKTKAPQAYYTNNRMTTAEDYQIVPLTQFQGIAKTKSVNRTASGISRYYDLIDPTGAYSSTNIFADEGVVYKENTEPTSSFSYTSNSEITSIIANTIVPLIKSTGVRDFYYDAYTRQNTGTNFTWNLSTEATNTYTGYFKESGPLAVGDFTTTNLKYVKPGALIKFVPPAGQHFMANGTLMTGAVGHTGSQAVIWTKVVDIKLDGSNYGKGNFTNGNGPITLADKVPSNAIISEIIPAYATALPTNVEASVVEAIKNYENFGLTYNIDTASWQFIDTDNIEIDGSFDLGFQGSQTDTNRDASWVLQFTATNRVYTIKYRNTSYVFRSATKNRFFYDEDQKIFDAATGKVVRDQIKILKFNTMPDSTVQLAEDYAFAIVGNRVLSTGFNDTREVAVSFNDSDDDGVVDNPDLFLSVVDPTKNVSAKYVYFKKDTSKASDYFDVVPSTDFVLASGGSGVDLSQYSNGQLFHFFNAGTIQEYNSSTGALVDVSDTYKALLGRDNINYNYEHAARYDRRIDPSVSNLIDLHILTSAYDTDYRQWIQNGQIGSAPIEPSTDALRTAYNPTLSELRNVSDEIVYRPVKYKLLFGPNADSNLQATFKVIKNPDLTLTDNDIQTSVIEAINQYFALENWNFGDAFYYTELSTYIHNALAPKISSIVIVPNQQDATFGSLFQIESNSDEIFISGATVDNVEIIPSISQGNIKASGNIVTSSTSTADVVSATTGGSTSTTTTTTTTTSSSSSGSSSSTGSSSSSGSSGY